MFCTSFGTLLLCLHSDANNAAAQNAPTPSMQKAWHVLQLWSAPVPPFAQLCNNKSMQPVPARVDFLSAAAQKENWNICQLDQLRTTVPCCLVYTSNSLEPQGKVMDNYISDISITLDHCKRFISDWNHWGPELNITVWWDLILIWSFTKSSPTAANRGQSRVNFQSQFFSDVNFFLQIDKLFDLLLLKIPFNFETLASTFLSNVYSTRPLTSLLGAPLLFSSKCTAAHPPLALDADHKKRADLDIFGLIQPTNWNRPLIAVPKSE